MPDSTNMHSIGSRAAQWSGGILPPEAMDNYADT